MPIQHDDFIIRKGILWSSDSVPDAEVRANEVEFIVVLGSNDPANDEECTQYTNCRSAHGGRTQHRR